MMGVSDTDRIRVAIATMVLRFRPANQNIASYIVDLRLAFAPSTVATVASNDVRWRTHALSLEREIAELRAQLEAEQIKNVSNEKNVHPSGHAATGNSSRPTDLENASPAGGSDGPAPSTKKKTRKSVEDAKNLGFSSRSGIGLTLQELFDRTDLPRLPGTDSLFCSIDDFLTTPMTHGSDVSLSLLLSAATRVIEVVATLLDRTILHTGTRPGYSKRGDKLLLQKIDFVLQDVLSRVLPFFTSNRKKRNGRKDNDYRDAFHTLTGTLATRILSPLLSSFFPLSETFLTAILPLECQMAPDRTRAGNGSPVVDIRTDVLSLFKNAFCIVEDSISLAKWGLNIRVALALEAVGALQRFFTAEWALVPEVHQDNQPRDSAIDGLSRTDGSKMRVRMLARKDALWFLCTILHFLVEYRGKNEDTSCDPGIDGKREEERGAGSVVDEILEKELLGSLFTLITRCKGTNRTGQVGLKNMTVCATAVDSWDWRKDDKGQKGDEYEGSHRGLKEGEQSAVHATGKEKHQAHEQEPLIPSVDVGLNAGGEIAGSKGRENDGVVVERGTGRGWDDLDEVSYGMLLAVAEHYWIRSLG